MRDKPALDLATPVRISGQSDADWRTRRGESRGTRVLIVGESGAAIREAALDLVAATRSTHVAQMTIVVVATGNVVAWTLTCLGATITRLPRPASVAEAAQTARRVAAALPPTVLVRHLACDSWESAALLEHVSAGNMDAVRVAGQPTNGPGRKLRNAADSATVPIVFGDGPDREGFVR
jgi:hypothetical protein